MSSLSDLDSCLCEFLQEKKSSNLKLSAAWDGLSTETQIKILSYRKRFLIHDRSPGTEERPLYLPNDVLSKAAKSQNVYLRYLAIIKHHHYHTYEDEELECLLTDDALIRSGMISESDLENNPETFFSLPDIEQYLCFSEFTFKDGEKILSIIEYGISNNILNKLACYNLLKECISSLRAKNTHYDLGSWCKQGCSEVALWKLALVVDKAYKREEFKDDWIGSLSALLVETLPCPDYQSEIEKEVLPYLSDETLFRFLQREDIWFQEFRKEVFFSEKKYADHLEEAIPRESVSRNCYFGEKDLPRIKQMKCDTLKGSVFSKHDLALRCNQSYRELIEKNKPTVIYKIKRLFKF